MVVLEIRKAIIRFIYRMIPIVKPITSVILSDKGKKKLKKFFLSTTSSGGHRASNLLPNSPMIEGINLIGYSRAEMGIGESCRIAANSISAAGIPFGIINFQGTSSARMEDLTWLSKEIKYPIYKINVFHINAEQMPELNVRYNDLLFKDRYNIGVWHWELPDFPEDWTDSFQYVDEIWAPSTFVAQALAIKSPVPVIKIPHSIEVTIKEYRDRKYYDLPENSFLFLTMYDVRSYQERKNPEASINAFKISFEPDDMSVGLVIKVNSYRSKSNEFLKLKSMIEGYRNIYIINETLSRNDVNALLNVCDSFISLHRSEGFGLGLAEAMYLGKPAIGTNWSSTTDFMNYDNSCLVKYTLVHPTRDFGPYKAYQYWAEPDINHASEFMKKLVDDNKFYTDIGSEGQTFIKKYYSPSSVGQEISKRLKYIGKWKFGGGI
ncbi:glycosyltransferase [Paenibacillus algicola]|nr:glycosyltransferase [Paenibacillus algicola]